MNELHQQQTENQALIFRVNHLQIQNDALFNSDQKHKLNLDQALFVIATLEQDKLLLEVRQRSHRRCLLYTNADLRSFCRRN